MLSLFAALLLLAEGDPSLGAPLKQGGFTLKPPRGFRMERMDLFHGTRVGGVAMQAGASRWLAAALVDGDSEEAASMMVSVVEAPFAVGPGARDELSAAAVHHFSDELNLKLSIERAEVIAGPSPHVQVLGSLRQNSQLRKIMIAAFPGEARHLVVTFSAPSGRFDALEKVLGESLDSVRPDGAPSAAPRTAAWVAIAVVGCLLAVSIGLWRRRVTQR